MDAESSNPTLSQNLAQLIQALRERDQIIATQARQIESLTGKIDKLISEINELRSDKEQSRKHGKRKSTKEKFPALKKPSCENRFQVLALDEETDLNNEQMETTNQQQRTKTNPTIQ